MSTVQETRTQDDLTRRRKKRSAQRAKHANEYDQYRALSFGAVCTLGMGVLSLPIVLLATSNPFLLLLPLLGTAVGASTWWKLRRRQDEYTGLGQARWGTLLSLGALLVGFFWSAYTYATEVPEGYQRVAFTELQPEASRPDIPFSPTAETLADQKVFVKGYVYPDGQTSDIKQFVLIPDMGTCCFGGQPKLTDMIQVTLEDPLRTEYSYTRRSFGGTFRVAATSADKVGTVIYQLDADYAK